MLIVLQLFSMSDARKRTTSGAAEAQQTANVSLYQVSRSVRLAGAGQVFRLIWYAVRVAGSGTAQISGNSRGCPLIYESANAQNGP